MSLGKHPGGCRAVRGCSMPNFVAEARMVVADVVGIARRFLDSGASAVEDRVRGDLREFALHMMAGDGLLRRGEADLFEAVFGHPPPENVRDCRCDGLASLLSLAREHDARQGSGLAPGLVKSIESLGTFIAAADEDVSPAEMERLSDVLDRLKGESPSPSPGAREGAPEQRRVFGRRGGSPPGAAASQTDAGSLLAEPVGSLLAELDAMVGLATVKKEVNTLVNLLRVRRLRRDNGLPVPEMSLHMAFTGNPGTGKTSVARLLGRLYGALGALRVGQLVEVDRSGLVGQWIGHTAQKTLEVIDKAQGSILFVDEAYALAGRGERDFGSEAVETLLKAMEDRRGDFIVIVAGYPGPMETFLASNPGLRSRFNRFIHFDDYSADELVDIFLGMAGASRYVLGEADHEAVVRLFTRMHAEKPPDFANGRTVRNLFETALANQANRLAAIAKPSLADLTTLVAADLPMG
ncbi:MAG: AAA family ATPase [Alphaproteobacteria bacterium]|nr:AAA family ATPase [Alphaproteobacteria bacterium]MBF0130126.1 AAA family ATPase [Alphaproteobacteria bacterium]